MTMDDHEPNAETLEGDGLERPTLGPPIIPADTRDLERPASPRAPKSAVSPKRPLLWRMRSMLRYVLPYPRKMRNYAALRWAWLRGQAKHQCYPVVLGVETTSRCNLSCPLCPRGGDGADRLVGDMEWEPYTHLIDALAPYLFQVRLHGLGEPTLHPCLPDMVRYAHDRHIFTNFHTNGHFLDDRLVDNLLDSGLDEVHVALDGMSKQTYRTYRRNGHLELVCDGLERLLTARRRRRARTPYVTIQFLVMAHNEHEVPALFDYAAANGVDRVQLKSVNIAWGEDAGKRSYLPEDQSYVRYLSGRRHLAVPGGKPCRRVWVETLVNWDGSVSICNSDHPGSGKVRGNVFTDGVDQILFSEDYVEARRRSMARAYDACWFCVNSQTPV
jgi:MoaA/NifB/PqqE/SkfB family radical SAM enzyme